MQPFFTTKDHGLRLGLSLSSAIIKLHGGKLWLDNRSGGWCHRHVHAAASRCTSGRGMIGRLMSERSVSWALRRF